MQLMTTELEAVEEAMSPHMGEIQAFFDGKPEASEIMEYMAWAYAEICDKVAECYARPVTEAEIPY